jgi:outer membrane protein assembly factor BamB
MKNFATLSILLASTALLSACSGDEKEIILSGDRIDIMGNSVTEIKPEAKAKKTQFVLTREVRNADWLQSGGRPGHNMHHIALGEKVHKSWRKSVGTARANAGGLLFAPVVKDGVIYAVDADGDMMALKLSNGKKVWKTSIETTESEAQEYSAALAIDENNLIATTSSGEVIAYNTANGEEVWRTNVGVPVRSAPSVALGKLFVIGHNNTLFALDSQTGRLLWTHNGMEERLALFGGGAPAVDVQKKAVLVPYSSGEIYALDVETGRYLWHDALSVASSNANLYSTLVDVEASPVVSENIAYAVNHNGMLAAFYVPNGRRLWSKDMSATQMPWVSGNVMYVVTDAGELVCLNRIDGSVRWVKKLNTLLSEDELEGGRTVWSSPMLAGKRVFVTSNKGAVVALHPLTGDVKGKLEISDGVTLAPIAVDKSLIFYTDDADIIVYK